jgi:hypothetical protein
MATPVPLNLIPDNLKPRQSNVVPMDMIPDNLKPKAPAPAAPKAAPTPDAQQAITDIAKQRADYTKQLQENAAKKATATAQLEQRLGARNKSNDSQYRSWLNQYEIRERKLQAELKALGGKEQFIAEKGRAPHELTLGEKIVDPFRTAARTAVESTGELGGALGIFGQTGENIGRSIQSGAKNLAANIGLAQPAEVTEALQFDPTMQNVEFLSGGAGSIAPYLVGGAAKATAKGVGFIPKAVRGASNLFLGAVASGQGATQAREQMDAYEKKTGEKVGPITRQLVTLGGSAIGLSELGVTEGLIARLPQNLRTTATAKLMNIASKAGMGVIVPAEAKAAIKATIHEIESMAAGRIAMRGFEEAGQEALSQFAQNAQERLAYNKDKQLSEDVAANAAAGFIVGGGVRAGSDAVQKLFPGGKEDYNAAREALRKQKALESIDAAIPDPKDPNIITRQKLDILSAPDADGNVVVRHADGRLVRMSMDTLESMRAPTEEGVPAGIFTKEMISGRLANAAGEKPNGQVTSFVNSLNLKLSNDLALNRPQAAADYISSLEGRFSRARRAQANQEAATQGTSAITDPTLRVLYEAKSILNDYRVEYGKAQAQPGAVAGTPTPPVSLTDMLVANERLRQQEGPMRYELLTQVAMDPNIVDKHAAFDEALAGHGLDGSTDSEHATLLDIMRMESAFETAAGESETQSLKTQQVERAGIVEDTVGRRNYDAEQKISKINADLLQARQEPLTEDEVARIQRRVRAADVFGPGGEYERTTEGEPSDEELAAFMQAENEYEAGTQGEPEVVPEDLIPDNLKGVPVTKVAPGDAGGLKETRRGMMGTQQGRPVEGAAELTPGMQNEQLLTERLAVLRNNNRLSDKDVGDVLRMMRVPTTKADFDALPESQRKRWEAAINQQLLINQRSEELNNTPNPKQKAKIKAALKVLNEQLDEMRGGIANAAGREAMARVTKRQADIRLIEEAYKTKQISKADRDTALRALRVQPAMGTVLSMREDAASELLTNPQADIGTLDLTEAVNVAEGTEQILAALQQAVADGKMTQDHADFATWVLENNPNLTRYVSLFVSNYNGQGYAGQYTPLERLIEIVAGAPSATTVHEVLHHAERLMPESAQDAIYDLWETRLNIKRRLVDGDAKRYLNLIHDYYFGSGDVRNLQFARMLLSDPDSDVSKQGFYQYFSPSEFWAENATDILRQRYDVKDSVIARIKQWLKEFASHLGSFVGLPTRSPVIRQLNQLANTTGHSKSERIIVGNEGPAFMYGGRDNAKLRFNEVTQYDTARMLDGMGNPSGPNSDVHKQTGWFKAPDGDWRFEFSDEGASFTDNWANLPQSKLLKEQHVTTLGEVLDHPLLYKYYPAAKNIKIKRQNDILDFSGSTQGWYNEQKNELVITPYAKDPIGTIVHEIQHWIQGQEDFARGGNTQTALSKASDEQLARYVRNEVSRLTAKIERNAATLAIWDSAMNAGPGLFEKYMQASRALKEARDKFEVGTPERTAAVKAKDDAQKKIYEAVFGVTKYSELSPEQRVAITDLLSVADANPDRINERYKKFEDAIEKDTYTVTALETVQSRDDIIAILKETRAAREAYLALFGEVEARSSADRRTLSAAERSDLTPYEEQAIAPDDYIVTRKLPGGASMSLGGRNAMYPDEMLDPTDLGLEPNPNVSREDRAGIMARLQGLLKQFSKAQSAIIRKLNYSYQDIVDYDKQLAAMYGIEQLPDNMAVSHKTELLNASRSGRQISLERNFIQPILRKMVELGVEEQDIGMYLWARGAKDRNALVRERNKAYPEGGSGMTDAEAEAILKEFALRGLEPKLKEIAKMHDRLVDFMLNTRVKEGLLTRQQADMARKMQPFYTPLKGFAAAGDMQTLGDEEAHNDTEYQKRLGIRRSEYMKSEGRKSMPFNPLYMLFADAKHLIQRASVNRVGQQFLENLINDPEANADVATYYTDSDPKVRVKPSENVEYPDGTPVNVNMKAEAKKYLVVKKDGVPYYVEFTNTPAGQAMKRAFDNMTPKQLNGFMKAWIKSANFMKSQLTRFSPPYLPRAFIRDPMDAVVNAVAAQTEKYSPAFGKKLGAKVAAYCSALTPTGRAINGTMFRYINGLEPKTAEQAEMLLLFDQFIEDGGSPGHAVIHDIELLTADASKSLKRLKALKDKNPTAFAKEAALAVPKFLDATSQMIDYKARFATYIAALEEGIDREGAARLALNSSLNLTRRGEWAQVLDSLFFFWSPSAESARRLKRLAFNSSNGRKIILAQMAIGVLSLAWNAYKGGGDDDRDKVPNYLDLPDAVQQGSLVLMTGPKVDDYVAIPLGFMLGFPTYVGQKLGEVAMGAISPGAGTVSIMDAAKSIGAAAVNTLSPVKPRGAEVSGLIASVAPSLTKPVVEAESNLNSFGSPIYTKKFDADRAASSLGREDTERVWKWIARSMNNMTGGSESVSGGFDRQPEWYRHIFESYLGGGYRTAEDTYKFIAGDNKGDKTLAQRLPIVRAYVGKGGEYIPMNKYFMRTESAPFYGHPGMGALVRQEEYEPEDFRKSREKFPVETDWRIMAAYKDAKKELDDIGRDRREELLGLKDAKQRQMIVDFYRKKQNTVYKEFNRSYNTVEKDLKQ